MKKFFLSFVLAVGLAMGTHSAHASFLDDIQMQFASLQNSITSLLARIADIVADDDIMAPEFSAIESSGVTSEFTYDSDTDIFVTIDYNNDPIIVGDETEITVTTKSTDCAITNVDIAINGESVTVLSSDPYRYQWIPNQAGNYVIKVSATDCRGIVAYATKSVVVIANQNNGNMGCQGCKGGNCANCPHAQNGGCKNGNCNGMGCKNGNCPHAQNGGCQGCKGGNCANCPHAQNGGCRNGNCPHANKNVNGTAI